MLAFLLAAVIAFAPPHGGKLEGRWRLGHGYTAAVHQTFAKGRFDLPVWNFEIVRAGRVIRRWHPNDAGQGMQVLTVDLNGDGIKDMLVYSDIGGSAGVGEYRLYGGPGMRRLWADVTSFDQGVVKFGHGRLDVWKAIPSSKTKASHESIHCCWSRWRHREWQWRHGLFTVVRRNVTKHPPQGREGPIRE